MDGAGRGRGGVAIAIWAGAAKRVAAVRSARRRRSCVCGIAGDHLPRSLGSVLYSVATSNADRSHRGAALRMNVKSFIFLEHGNQLKRISQFGRSRGANYRTETT